MISDRQYRLLSIVNRYHETRAYHLYNEYVAERQPWFYTRAGCYRDMERLKDLGFVTESPRRTDVNRLQFFYQITTKGRDALKGIFHETPAQLAAKS